MHKGVKKCTAHLLRRRSALLLLVCKVLFGVLFAGLTVSTMLITVVEGDYLCGLAELGANRLPLVRLVLLDGVEERLTLRGH